MTRFNSLLFYYFSGLLIVCLIGFLYSLVLYPLEVMFVPADLSLQFVPHGIIESSISLVETYLLLPEIIVFFIASIFGFDFSVSQQIITLNPWIENISFIHCQLLLAFLAAGSYVCRHLVVSYNELLIKNEAK